MINAFRHKELQITFKGVSSSITAIVLSIIIIWGNKKVI